MKCLNKRLADKNGCALVHLLRFGKQADNSREYVQPQLTLLQISKLLRLSPNQIRLRLSKARNDGLEGEDGVNVESNDAVKAPTNRELCSEERLRDTATLSLKDRVAMIKQEGRPMTIHQLQKLYKEGGISYK